MGKKKKTLLTVSLLMACTISAFALLKTGVFGKEKNAIVVDPNIRYDIVADLDGGKFEVSAKPEFTKMDNGKWLYKYKPTISPTKIAKPVKDGYEFTGWTVGDSLEIKPEYTIPAWNKENINLKAHWKAADSVLLDGPHFSDKIRRSDNFSNINHIKFVKDYPDPNGIDLSEKQDKSIMGSFNDGIFTVACGGKILANPDSSEMFRNISTPSEITFENFDTTNVTNMENMFYVHSIRDSYARLRKINGLDKFNTSNVTNMTGMFSGCALVENIDVSSFDTSKVTSMYRMFEGCETVKTLDVSNFNTSNVEDMNSMFAVRWSGTTFENRNKPANLTEIIGLERFNTSNVWSMQEMFSGCTNITNLNVSTFDTSKVVFMQGMFNDCWSLASIDVSNFNTSNVTSMSYMFKECSKLKSIDVSNFNTSKVVNMSGMFSTGRVLDDLSYPNNYHKDSALESVIGFENLDTSKVADMSDMFIGDIKLNQINLKNLNMSNVKNASYMFGGCINLSGEIIIDNFSVTDYTDMFYGCSSDSDAEFWVKWKTPEDKKLGRNMVNTKREGIDHVYLWEPASTLVDGRTFQKKVREYSPDLIREIYFSKGEADPNGLDLSEKQDKSITGVYKDGVFTVTSPGQIMANPDCAYMFGREDHDRAAALNDYFVSYKIHFDNFNTTKVKTMEGMFSCLVHVFEYDLSNFDLRNVENISYMFECYSGTSQHPAELTLNNPNIKNYNNFFYSSGSYNSKLILNYTSECKHIVEDIIKKYNEYDTQQNAILIMGKEYVNGKQNTKSQSNILSMFRSVFKPNIDTTKASKPGEQTTFISDTTTEPTPQTNKTVTITLNNGSMAMYPVQKIQVNSGKIGDLAKPDLNPKYAGQFGGYFYDKNYTIPVKPNDVVTQDIELYAKW